MGYTPLTYIKGDRNMPIVRSKKASPSKGEELVLSVLETFPGVLWATQSEQHDLQDRAGIDITVQTDPEVYPFGDRTVYLQIKGHDNQGNALFRARHAEDRLVIITIPNVGAEKSVIQVRSQLKFIFERKVLPLILQDDYTLFRVALGNLNNLVRDGIIASYKYLGNDLFELRKSGGVAFITWEDLVLAPEIVRQASFSGRRIKNPKRYKRTRESVLNSHVKRSRN